jgi:CIC family chloride channel protein
VIISARLARRRVTRAASSRWDRWLDRFERLGLSENATVIAFAIAVGLAAAAGVVVFYRAIDAVFELFFALPARSFPNLPLFAYRPLITGAALALAAAIWRRTGAGGDGLTVPDVQLAVVRRSGRIPGRAAVGRTVASAVTIGGGGSAGSEGPVAVLGAAAGSLLSRTFRFSAERTVVLVGAGAAAGIAAAFNAPLAGAFFALEEILGSLRVTAFPPIVMASVVGAVISRAVFGNHPAFPIPREYGYAALIEILLFFPLLGAVCGVMSALFVRVHFGVGDFIRSAATRFGKRSWVVPWLAGALVGAAAFASGGLLVGAGHLSIPLSTFGRMAWSALLVLALGKIVITALTLQGGGSGGLFTPSLFVGAAAGGSLGVLLKTLFPTLPISPESYALVGMGALVSGSLGAPITGILLVFEMTNDYAIVLPLMLAVVVGYPVARKLAADDLYSGWLRRRGEHLRHGTDRDVLAGLRVSDAYDRNPIVVREEVPLATLLGHIGHRDQALFPVVDDAGTYVGVLTTADLGAVARAGHALDDVVIAADVAHPSPSLTPDDSLLAAIKRMGTRGDASLPVVDPATGRFLGLVSRSHILSLYEGTLARTGEHAAFTP